MNPKITPSTPKTKLAHQSRGDRGRGFRQGPGSVGNRIGKGYKAVGETKPLDMTRATNNTASNTKCGDQLCSSYDNTSERKKLPHKEPEAAADHQSSPLSVSSSSDPGAPQDTRAGIVLPTTQHEKKKVTLEASTNKLDESNIKPTTSPTMNHQINTLNHNHTHNNQTPIKNIDSNPTSTNIIKLPQPTKESESIHDEYEYNENQMDNEAHYSLESLHTTFTSQPDQALKQASKAGSSTLNKAETSSGNGS